MSPAKGRARAERRELLMQIPLLIWLVVLWLLLWGHVTVVSVLSGIALALLVTRVFYLPPVELSGRFNVYWGAVFLGHFVVELTRASFLVAAQALNPRWTPRNSVIAVALHTRSDFVLTMTAETITLVPGSIVIEADRERSVLYLHALGTNTLEDVEDVRQRVLKVEERIVRTIGTADDVWRINRDHRESGRQVILQSRRQREHERRREDEVRTGRSGATGERS